MKVVDFLTPFEDAQVIDALDVELARGLMRIAGLSVDGRPDVALGAALASRAPSHGHLCVDLRDASATPPGRPGDEAPDEDVARTLPWPDADAWIAGLRACTLVRLAGCDRASPLVLDAEGRLYLDRYWQYEDRLARAVRARLVDPLDPGDPAALARVLAQLVPDDPSRPGWRRGVLDQRAAALVALRSRFAVLTGGPGTGKTTSVAVVLLLLLRQAAAGRRPVAGETPPLRILLLAPTGKAAARMAESIGTFVHRVESATPGAVDPELAALLPWLPREASTLHRALGAHPDRPGRFRHTRDNPLPVDVAIIDEASMVDAALMARTFDALPAAARVLLLGDQDQLASVEAGAILGDLCGVGGAFRDPDSARPIADPDAGVSRALADLASRVVGPDLDLPVAPDGLPIRDAIARLGHPFRFGEASGIGRLSRAVRDLGRRTGPALAAGVDAALDLLSDATGRDGTDLTWLPHGPDEGLVPDGRIEPGAAAAVGTVRAVVRDGWVRVLGPALESVRNAPDEASRLAAVADALDALQGFRILCSHHGGPRGVRAMNRLVRAALGDLLPGEGDWYEGRPVLVLQNDYRLGLFNGDVGFVLPDGPGPGRPLVAWFPGVDGLPRAFPQGRLPALDTVFAMTIHKSQGSQFGRVVVLLPPDDSVFVTRELVYTALTRARDHALIVATEDALRGALSRRVNRASGLREAIWGCNP